MVKPVVWVADVGSIQGNRFGWCRSTGHQAKPGARIDEFAEGIARDLKEGMHVAFGFECPLFVPVTSDPMG